MDQTLAARKNRKSSGLCSKVGLYCYNFSLTTEPFKQQPNGALNTNFFKTIEFEYNNYSNLVSSLQVSQSNTYNKLLNTLTSQSIAINVDYTDYNNFAFFGSVESRLNNFYDKVKQIEDYNSLITNYTLSASLYPNLQTEITLYSSSISNIISTLDGYETYLYFESSSYAWPKSTSILPYTLYSTGSVSAINWFNTNINLASSYDELNQNNFIG